MLTLICSLFVVFDSVVQGDEVVITTNGAVQGTTVESEGYLLEAFLGIPYAEPPTGRLRFAKPVPKTQWEGVYDASKLPPPCIQNVTQPSYFTPDITDMSEDCLYLNIWVPHSQSNDSKLKTILFYIHGGAFNTGSSNMKLYDGAKLAARGDVIVVTVNYRVGALGFYLAFIDDAGGNMGMRDIILALKWVRSNAVSFHGDPENIVLIGESAGAIAASSMATTSTSKHMVKRLIAQSGSPMMLYVLEKNALTFDMSKKLAKLVGCANKNITLEKYPRKIVNCLKRIPSTKISEAEGILMSINFITFIPRMEDEIFPRNIIEMVRNGELKDMEILTGITKDEGSFFLTAAAPQYFGVHGSDPGTISKNLATQLIKLISQMFRVADSKEVSSFYVNSVTNGTSEKYLEAVHRFLGDLLMTCSTIFQAEFHSATNPVYFYMLTHQAVSSPLDPWMGVTHFDDVQYVFGNPMHGNFTAEEQNMSNLIMKRWINFAKTG